MAACSVTVVNLMVVWPQGLLDGKAIWTKSVFRPRVFEMQARIVASCCTVPTYVSRSPSAGTILRWTSLKCRVKKGANTPYSRGAAHLTSRPQQPSPTTI